MNLIKNTSVGGSIGLPIEIETPSRRRSPASSRAFTLLEVILALSIAAAILGVVLYFYRQAEILRTELLRETSQVSAARLILDRLTTELSTAQSFSSFQKGLSGSSNNIQFVRLEAPTQSVWPLSLESTSSVPATVFRVISYALLTSTNDTNALGLTRLDEPLLSNKPQLTNEDELLSADAVTPAPRNPVSTDQIRFLRFRYWDGAAWQDSWNNLDLPSGVEVSVGADSLPPETSPDDYPYELYRRVIFLPNRNPLALQNDQNTSTNSLDNPSEDRSNKRTPAAMEEGGGE